MKKLVSRPLNAPNTGGHASRYTRKPERPKTPTEQDLDRALGLGDDLKSDPPVWPGNDVDWKGGK